MSDPTAAVVRSPSDDGPIALPPDVALAMPGRHRWDMRLVEPVTEPQQAQPVAAEAAPSPTPQTSPDAVQAARERLKWAETAAEYARAQEHLRLVLQGRQVASESVAPPVPVVPPSSALGWDVSKRVIRDAAGLVVEVSETWRPAAPEPA